jgi:hypothetical protein
MSQCAGWIDEPEGWVATSLEARPRNDFQLPHD